MGPYWPATAATQGTDMMFKRVHACTCGMLSVLELHCYSLQGTCTPAARPAPCPASNSEGYRQAPALRLHLAGRMHAMHLLPLNGANLATWAAMQTNSERMRAGGRTWISARRASYDSMRAS